MYYILYVSPICLPNSRSYFLASIGVISFALFNNFKSLGRSLEKFRNSRNLRIGVFFEGYLPALFFFFFSRGSLSCRTLSIRVFNRNEWNKGFVFCCVVRATNNDNRALFNVSVARTRTLVARPRKKAGYRVINNASLFLSYPPPHFLLR